MELGFHPHGDIYLCFFINDNADLQEIRLDKKTEETIRKTTSPFVFVS